MLNFTQNLVFHRDLQMLNLIAYMEYVVEYKEGSNYTGRCNSIDFFFRFLHLMALFSSTASLSVCSRFYPPVF